jgi:antitoxin VapB
MQTAKLFQKGENQVVSLPKEFHFDNDRVYIKRVGNAVVLFPYSATWEPLVASLALFSRDFMSERKQPPIQDR